VPDETPLPPPSDWNIEITSEQKAGTWANFARVSHSMYEFTLDFIRMDFAARPPEGIVVARVSVSPLFISQLLDAITVNFHQYSQKAMPPEVRDAERRLEAGRDDVPPEEREGD
jgi:hypothetical protein